MTDWRTLRSDPPPRGKWILVREKGFTRPEMVGQAHGFYVLDAREHPYPPAPDDGNFHPGMVPPRAEYLVVELNGQPEISALSHLEEARDWFAARTKELDGKPYALKPDGAVRLWELMDEAGVGMDGIELGVYRSPTSLDEIRKRKREGEWMKVQMDKSGKYRTWIARVRPE